MLHYLKTNYLFHFLQVQEGSAKVSHLTATINNRLQDQLNKTLSDLQQSGGQLYLGVFVTNIQSKVKYILLLQYIALFKKHQKLY